MNFFKSGPILGAGGRGATVNFGPRGTQMKVGLPGTGLSYRTTISRSGGGKPDGRQVELQQRDRTFTIPGWVRGGMTAAICGLGVLLAPWSGSGGGMKPLAGDRANDQNVPVRRSRSAPVIH